MYAFCYYPYPCVAMAPGNSAGQVVGHSVPAPTMDMRGRSRNITKTNSRKRRSSQRSSSSSSSTYTYIRKLRKGNSNTSCPDVEPSIFEVAPITAAVATPATPQDTPGTTQTLKSQSREDQPENHPEHQPEDQLEELLAAALFDPSDIQIEPQPVLRRRISKKTFMPRVPQEEVARLFVASKQSVVPRACASFPDLCPEWASSEVAQDISRFLAFDTESGGEAAATWQPIIERAYPQLSNYSLHGKLWLLCVRTLRNRVEHEPKAHQCIDFFSGDAFLSLGHVELGLRCARFDFLYGEAHDCLKNEGERAYLDAVTYTEEKCLCWFGTKCSSFLGLCRKQSDRRESNGWVGNIHRPFVSEGNGMMHMSSLCYFLAWATKAIPALEQPTESSMGRVRPMRTVLEFIPNIRRTTTWLGAYGAPSPKPIQIWHCDEKLVALKRKRPESVKMPVRLCTETKREGKRTYSGNKKHLVASSAYPRDFGRAVAGVTYAEARALNRINS